MRIVRDNFRAAELTCTWSVIGVPWTASSSLRRSGPGGRSRACWRCPCSQGRKMSGNAWLYFATDMPTRSLAPRQEAIRALSTNFGNTSGMTLKIKQRDNHELFALTWFELQFSQFAIIQMTLENRYKYSSVVFLYFCGELVSRCELCAEDPRDVLLAKSFYSPKVLHFKSNWGLPIDINMQFVGSHNKRANCTSSITERAKLAQIVYLSTGHSTIFNWYQMSQIHLRGRRTQWVAN